MAGLSLVDVINLKNNPSRESRIQVAEKMCDEFNSRSFSDEERIIISEIFRMLAKDAEVAIRQSLSEKLKHNSRLPEDIAFMLASDVMQVALPVLQFSPALSEDDLISIVRSTKELAKLLAVTKRDVVTPAVSQELVNKKQIFVTESLLQNKGAFVNEEDFARILAEYGHVDSLMSALIGRDQLPVTVAEKMLGIVTGALKTQLMAKHGAHAHAIKEAVSDAREHVTLTHISQPSSPNNKEKLAQHLYSEERLSSSLVVRSICLGDLEFFISSMAKLTGWPRTRVEQVLADRDITAMRRLYHAAGLPQSIQDATLAVLVFVLEELRAGHKGGTAQFAGRVIERIVAAGYDRSVNNMTYLLTLVGKKPHVATYH